MNNKEKIRMLAKDDIDQLLILIENHAIFEKSTFSPVGKKEALTVHLFGENPSAHCLVADVENKLVGYATYAKQFSTWDASFYYYMDCLFLDEEVRSRGIGERLVNQIKAAAREDGVSLIQWQTPDFNIRAIKFYRRIGATSKDKERFFLNVK